MQNYLSPKKSLFALLGVAAVGYLAYRRFGANFSEATYVDPEVAGKLPIAKGLETVPDVSANYDIDGVSFDDEGVIVSGDASKPIASPI